MNNFFKKITFIVAVFAVTSSCTNLEEVPLDGVSIVTDPNAVVDTATFLQVARNGLRQFQGQGNMFALSEMTTDALAGPTRGGDWDDNGAWRQIHTLTFNSAHVHVRDTWNILLSNVFNCNQVIFNSTKPAEVAEARFLRAFYYFYVVDFFGKTPYRLKGGNLKDDALIWTRAEAANFIIAELEAIVGSLPARTAGDASIANQDAANFLLAKLYLNKGVYTAANPAGPYTFAAADMTKVVQHVEAIKSSLAPNYWDNFKPENNTSPEILFSSKNIRAGAGGDIQSRWRMAQHYNQRPDGWNGFTTLAEYYDRFQTADKRKNYTDADIIRNFGNPAGFQIGQQYGSEGYIFFEGKKTEKFIPKASIQPKDLEETDNRFVDGIVDRYALKDRNKAPLIFTKEITLVTRGSAIETAGIRAEKYIPDNGNLSTPENDYVFFRYSDALLMKEEAILRGGTGSPSTILADLATRSGVTAAPATLDGIYAERGRELWWEGWRRNDMIRFGTFLKARELKKSVTDPKFILMPIPAAALLNPNLKQNPGY